MEKIFAKSPDRFSFIINETKSRLEKDPDNQHLKNLLAFYRKCREENEEKPVEEEKRYNLEYDLRSCEWLVKKCKESEKYSQNLYAALCDNEFKKTDLLDSFLNTTWFTSWRGAGGIVANLREKGDYIEFYCSGMSNKDGRMAEGEISKEVEEDLRTLGWRAI